MFVVLLLSTEHQQGLRPQMGHLALSVLKLAQRSAFHWTETFALAVPAGCHPSCKTCRGGGPFSCSSCNASLVLSHTNMCVPACSPGYYRDESHTCKRECLSSTPFHSVFTDMSLLAPSVTVPIARKRLQVPKNEMWVDKSDSLPCKQSLQHGLNLNISCHFVTDFKDRVLQ